MVDLNGFKLINDRLGHAEGDRALVATADVMRSTLRSRDIIPRLGGDEFIVIAGAGTDHARLVDRLAAGLRGWRDELDWYRLEPTIGMVVIGPDDDRPLWRLVDDADQRMYERRGTPRPATSGVLGAMALA
jgi:diguanylate cyclase (GGDEF)-like protein